MEENIQKVISLYKSDYTQEILELFHDDVVNFFNKNRVLNSKSPSIIHSVKSRFKDADHLKDKLERKLAKGEIIDEANFFQKINDLIGVRVLHLYQEQFIIIHNEINKKINSGVWAMYEPPKAYTWDPETKLLYDGLNIKTEVKDSYYTSVHYIIKLNSNDINPICCEIQVRTLFEEIWGEIDHTINYPHSTQSIACKEQLRVLSKLVSTGTRLADSIFRSHKEYSGFSKNDNSILEVIEGNQLLTNEKIEDVLLLNNEILSFSQYALQDENFPLNDSSELTEVISNLKIHNWYVQNPAIDLLSAINLNNLLENQDSKDKLFVLGRNIYQSASGSASNSIDLINSIKSFFTKYSDFVINCIYSGILFEIFFDKKGVIREGFNRSFFCEIFELQTLERLNESIKFIQDKLIPFQSRIFVIPSQEPKLINIKIDFFEKSNTERQINVINSILINDIEVLTEDESNYLNYCITGYIDYVASILSNAYLIPLNQISIINKGQIEQNFFELSNDKYLKKI